MTTDTDKCAGTTHCYKELDSNHKQDALRLLTEEFRPVRDVADSLNISYKKLRELIEPLRIRGLVEVSPNDRCNYTPTRKQEALRLILEDGRTVRDIGKSLNISYEDLRDFVRALRLRDESALGSLKSTAIATVPDERLELLELELEIEMEIHNIRVTKFDVYDRT